MFGKMMNRYYYGKSGKGDYNREDLPQTRWALFWEMLRVRFSGLIRLNFIYLVVWIPAIVVIARGAMMWYSGMVALSEMLTQAEAGEILMETYTETAASFGDYTKAILLQTLALLAPSIAITGPATAGVAYVTRNWARDEHAFIWSDFIDAAKANWKPALLTSVITGFMPLILYVCFTFYGSMARSNVIFLFPQILVVVMVLLWFCALMYIYPQIVTYTLNYRGVLKNSLIMVVGRLPMTVGLKLLSLVPAALCLLVGFLTPYLLYALMVLLLYYVLLGFTLSRFVGASYSNAVFDRYINPRVEGAQVGRGLYIETDDEDDAEESAPAEAEPAAPAEPIDGE